jgi:hypothetical protein
VVTGADFVVVGVVVVGVVVVVVVGSDERALDVVLPVDVVAVVVGVEPVTAALLAPGCSLATTTPTSAVVPVATIATAWVRRRSRRLARRRDSTEFLSGCSGMDPSKHRPFRAAADRTVALL